MTRITCRRPSRRPRPERVGRLFARWVRSGILPRLRRCTSVLRLAHPVHSAGPRDPLTRRLQSRRQPPFGKTPLLSASDSEALGYSFVVAPIETVLVAVHAVERLAVTFLHDGSCRGLEHEMVTFDALKTLLGLPELKSPEIAAD